MARPTLPPPQPRQSEWLLAPRPPTNRKLLELTRSNHLGSSPENPPNLTSSHLSPQKNVLSLLNPSYEHFSALGQDGISVSVSTSAVTVLRVPHHKPSSCVNIADVAKRTKILRLARNQSSHSKNPFLRTAADYLYFTARYRMLLLQERCYQRPY